MWPDKRLTDLLGIEHPIIQAPMAGSVTPELAAAVSNAGALGSLGCGTMARGDIAAAVTSLRDRTNAPFNLNFFANPAPTPTSAALSVRTKLRLKPWYERFAIESPAAPATAPEPGFQAWALDLLLEVRPRIVSFHFGLPDPEAVAALKAAGIVILSSATNVAEARALEAAGVDAVIAQGWEAGGHRGSHIANDPGDGVGTMALVPQVVDAVSVPVVAAGGIGDGRGIAAAFALGASGVQIGTGFLSAPEAATDPRRRELLREAADQDTIVTNAISGRPARAARSTFAKAMSVAGTDWPDFPRLYDMTSPLLRASAAAASDDVLLSPLRSGGLSQPRIAGGRTGETAGARGRQHSERHRKVSEQGCARPCARSTGKETGWRSCFWRRPTGSSPAR